MHELTLAVVGIDFPNADGSNRRSAAMMTVPGDPVELVPEPNNQHDRNAIAVFTAQGTQLGYVTAERAPFIGGKLKRGEDAIAIFQGIEGSAAYIRVRFGGGQPTLPASGASASNQRIATALRSPSAAPYDPHAFYPDPDGPEFGA